MIEVQFTCGGCGGIVKKMAHPGGQRQKYCSRACFYTYQRRFGGMTKNQYSMKPWTAEEDGTLRNEYPGCVSIRAFALTIGRSGYEVRSRAKKLGLVRSPDAVREASRIGGSRNRGNKRPDLARRNSEVRLVGERNSFYGKKHTEETRKFISDSQKENSAFFRLNADPEFQKKRREAHEKVMRDPEHQRRMLMALLASQGRSGPNKTEKKLDGIIQSLFPGQYVFTGDGSVIIDGLNPDWTNVNGQKKLIELFGEHVHKEGKFKKKVPERGTFDGRKVAFAKYGYDVLIIWSREVKDVESVRQKLMEFHNS